MSKSFENNDLNIDIKIDNWNGSTNNGQNEKELVQSLNDYIDQETHNDIYGKQLVDIKMIFTTIIGIIMMFVVNIEVLVHYVQEISINKLNQRNQQLIQLNHQEDLILVILN